MGNRWIPDDGGEFATMAVGFAAAIAKDPEKYTLEPHDAEMLTRAVVAFSDTRRPTVSAIARKEAREKAEAIVRRLGRIIRASDRISDADKAMVRIYPRDPHPAGHGPPTTRPMLRFVGAVNEGNYVTSGQHVLAFAQRPDIKGRYPRQKKPPGVVRIELFVDLVPDGQNIPRYPGEFLGGRPWYLGSYTTSPIRVSPPTPPVPMLIVYWGRWADAKCNVGPFSQTCRARAEGWGGIAATPLLGPMPDIRQLEKDPKYITTITQLRQFEQVKVERVLPEPDAERAAARQVEGAAPSPKQLPLIDAA